MTTTTRVSPRIALLTAVLAVLSSILGSTTAAAQDAEASSIDAKLNSLLEPVAYWAEWIVFHPEKFSGHNIPIVLILLGFTALFLTIWFKFINLTGFPLALKTVRGKITDPDAPGQITHFQALSAAISATVGLGNIAGVAVAIGIGGPGATFWMIVVGLLGMTTKFCECTLGVRYRRINEDGSIRGGAMYYLRDGFRERFGKGMGVFGLILAFIFAISCIGGTFGAGCMFQVNQAHDQFANTFGILNEGWQFGLVLGIMAGAVIIGGIVWIARVTAFLVPFMCAAYVLASLFVIFGHIGDVPAAIGTIINSAFSPGAAFGGLIGVLIQGMKRAAFSNEAGFGSAPIAHSAVKTKRPASEGHVALLEPFIDTVVVCTMTALVIILTGMWSINANVKTEGGAQLYDSAAANASVITTLDQGALLDIQNSDTEGWHQVVLHDSETSGWVQDETLQMRKGWDGGIWLTSKAFESSISWFKYILAISVFLFAFSTMISWSYYGEQAVIFMFGQNKGVIIGYKIIFCLMAIVGGAASLGNVLRLSDAMVFAMVFPNLIGIYFLLPVIKDELKSYRAHAKSLKD